MTTPDYVPQPWRFNTDGTGFYDDYDMELAKFHADLAAHDAELVRATLGKIRELAQSAKADRDGSLLAAATDFHGRPFPVYVDAESILRILDQEQTYTTSELENR